MRLKKKNWKKILKFKTVYTDFPLYKTDWEEFEQNNTSIVLNISFVSCDIEESLHTNRIFFFLIGIA